MLRFNFNFRTRRRSRARRTRTYVRMNRSEREQFRPENVQLGTFKTECFVFRKGYLSKRDVHAVNRVERL